MATKKKTSVTLSPAPLARPHSAQRWVVRDDGSAWALGAVGALQRATATGSEVVAAPEGCSDLVVARRGTLIAAWTTATVDDSFATTSFRLHHGALDLDWLAAGYVPGTKLSCTGDGKALAAVVTTKDHAQRLLLSDGVMVTPLDVPAVVDATFDDDDRLFVNASTVLLRRAPSGELVPLEATRGAARLDATRGRFALVGDHDSRFRLVDLDADRALFEWDEKTTKRGAKVPSAARAAFVDDDRFLVTSSVGVTLVDAKAGKVVAKGEHVAALVPTSAPVRVSETTWRWGALVVTLAA